MSIFIDFMPVVRNIREASELAHMFDHVLTAGPSEFEVQFGHSDHLVVSFGDTVEVGGPTFSQVSRMLEWANERDGDMLIHCHAGMSRSTATAWGVMIGHGWDPEEALASLVAAHPRDRFGGVREFMPNGLLVSHVGRFYGIDDLVEIGRDYVWGVNGWDW